MNKTFRIMTYVLIILCFVFIAASCAPSVPKEEYDKTVAELTTAKANLDETKAELATVRADLDKMKEQLAGVSSAWSSLKPNIEVGLYLMENRLTWARYRLGEITVDERREQTGNQWGRITVALKAIGNDELTENMRSGWFAKAGTERDEFWSKAYRLMISLVEQDVESLSKKLAP